MLIGGIGVDLEQTIGALSTRRIFKKYKEIKKQGVKPAFKTTCF